MLMTVLTFHQCLQLVSRVAAHPNLHTEAKTDIINTILKYTEDSQKCDANASRRNVNE